MIKKNFLIFLFLIINLNFICAFNFGDSIQFNFPEDEEETTTTTTSTSNITHFLNLTDTPASYTGEGSNCVKVNAGETALEFGDCGAGGTGDITSVQGDEYITNGSNSGDVQLVFNETLMNQTIDSRDSDTTYTAGSNLSLDGTEFSLNESGVLNWLDNIYVRIINLVTLVGNWSADKDNYYNKTYVYNKTEIDNEGYLTSESDPLWTANYSAYNDTWSQDNYEADTNCSVDGSCPDIVYESEESGLNVNSSDYWDGLNTPSDISIFNLSDVENSANDLDFLKYNSTSGKWYPASIETIYYNATAYTLVAGTLDGGTITDTQHPDGGYDSTTMNFSEAGGSPGLDLRFNFTGVNDITDVIIRVNDEGNTQSVQLQLWDYDSSVWEDYNDFYETNGFRVIELGVFDSSEHIEDGVVQLRFYHSSAGNINHEYYIDWLAVAEGFGIPASQEVDPIWESEKDEYYNKTQVYNNSANIEHSYNITADYYFGNGSELSGIITSESDPIYDSENNTIARIGDCPTGQFVQNTTTGGVECAIPSGSDTNCSVDGSCPDIVYESEESGLNVNSSDYWDGLNTPGDIGTSELNNDEGFITNSTMNKSVSCTDIIGGSDLDYCTDADSGGDGYNTTEEMQDAVGSAFNITLIHDDANDEMGVNKTWLDSIYALIGDIFSGSWNDLTDVPAGFADGVDNDTDTNCNATGSCSEGNVTYTDYYNQGDFYVNGSLGVGTNSPSGIFHLKDDISIGPLIETTDGTADAKFVFYNGDQYWQFGLFGSYGDEFHIQRFSTLWQEDFQIDTDGNIEIENNLNLSGGNQTINSGNYICLNQDCSRYMYDNGTGIILQG